MCRGFKSLLRYQQSARPERDWTWLDDIKARLCAVPPTVRATKPVITSLQLLDLGTKLMDEGGGAH